MDLEIKIFNGREIEPYLPQMAQLRIKVFREFPYLYEGSIDYEKQYLNVYLKSKKSIVIIVLNNGEAVGASTGLPLSDETEEFQRAFSEKEINIENVFYFGESIILPDYRGNGWGKKFFKWREDFAQKALPDLSHTTFCAVDRPIDHPLRPSSYRPLDGFWQRQGYEKQNSMKVYYPWKDIDKDQEDTKSMTFWIKRWE